MRRNILGAFFLLLSPCCTFAEELHVAVNMPLTGALATFGKSVQEGVALATDPGGCSQNSGVTYAWEDNQGLAREAVTVARKQLALTPNIYVSGVLPQYMAIRDSLRQAGIPHFVWLFDMNIRPFGENNFRTWASFSAEPELFVNYAKKLKPERIAVVYVEMPSTDEEYLKHVLPDLEQAGFKDPLVIGYTIDESEFREIGARLKAYNPDLIFISAFPDALVSMIRTFRELRLIHDGNTVGSYDLLDTASLLDAAELEGIRATTPSFLLENSNAKAEEWKASFRKRFSKEPLYTHAYAYDMACIIAQAARVAKSSAPEDLNRALMSTDLEGVTGKLKFDDYGDLLPHIELGVFRDGQIVRDAAASEGER